MSQIKLTNELVEAPDGGYYQVTLTLLPSNEATCTLPDIGKVTVYKEHYQFPEPHDSFAWKIKKEAVNT